MWLFSTSVLILTFPVSVSGTPNFFTTSKSSVKMVKKILDSRKRQNARQVEKNFTWCDVTAVGEGLDLFLGEFRLCK